MTWTLPEEVQLLNPAAWLLDVHIPVYQGGVDTTHAYYGRVPLNLSPQHVNLSAAMVTKLKSLGDELRCRIRVRKSDNSCRSYSNTITLWKAP